MKKYSKKHKTKCQHKLFDEFVTENKSLLNKLNDKNYESSEGSIKINKDPGAMAIWMYRNTLKKNWIGQEKEKIEDVLLYPHNLFNDKDYLLKSKDERLLLEKLKGIKKRYVKLLEGDNKKPEKPKSQLQKKLEEMKRKHNNR